MWLTCWWTVEQSNDPHASSMAQPTARQTTRLPWELILQIVNCFSPQRPDAILPASDAATKALVALTRVCRSIYPAASSLLYQHCVYVDSRERAMALARTLSPRKEGSVLFPREITKIFLGPYPNARDSDSTSSDDSVSPLDDRPLALCIHDLLTTVAPTLRTLVIDMPLRSLYPEDDTNGVRLLLRQGFTSLEHLEAFVSVRDELYLAVLHPRDYSLPVWVDYWPNLRRLSLYNEDFDRDMMWSCVASKRHLEMAIFARPDGTGSDSEDEQAIEGWRRLAGINVKRAWIEALEMGSSGNEQQHLTTRDLTTRITLVFADSDILSQPDFSNFEREWQELDPENRIEILLADVPAPIVLEDDAVGGAEVNHPELTQEFVKKLALEGKLWDKDGPWIRRT
ncbi:hypothetical protein NLG97_g3592 [Lecanicillium saksenae]|uniref:Uncharacterized protein n=1 Tax=Lecanicillium saksenae TaxID=468837 RepID=A0ACC1QY84_9HYPO|nr:hypothetical protein NLG97_g3592 [Lecanicillium saksenae]